MSTLRREVEALYPLRAKEDEHTLFSMDDIYTRMKEAILTREVEKAILAVKSHSVRDDSLIGERDLRKILNQCLAGVSIHLKNVFVD
jgi:hypothetical protein